MSETGMSAVDEAAALIDELLPYGEQPRAELHIDIANALQEAGLLRD